MTPMLEKVSRALCEASGQSWDDSSDGYREICEGFAIAAVRALREPDEEMLEACGNGECRKWAEGAWRSMIDSILADTGDGE